jgi:hypothetical protein
MAERLVKIITERLLSLQEAFGRLQPDELSALLLPAVLETVRQDCGEFICRQNDEAGGRCQRYS